MLIFSSERLVAGTAVIFWESILRLISIVVLIVASGRLVAGTTVLGEPLAKHKELENAKRQAQLKPKVNFFKFNIIKTFFS